MRQRHGQSTRKTPIKGLAFKIIVASIANNDAFKCRSFSLLMANSKKSGVSSSQGKEEKVARSKEGPVGLPESCVTETRDPGRLAVALARRNILVL